MQISSHIENRFYVYEHRRAGTDRPFYVGKGSGKRLKRLTGRSEEWHSIVLQDGGYDARVLASELPEELAYLVERERIDQLKKLGFRLCNKMNGGGGLSGWKKAPTPPEVRARISASVRARAYVHTPEARAKMSAAHKGHKYNLGRIQSEEEKERRASKLRGRKYGPRGAKHTPEHKAYMSQLMTGRAQPLHECPHCGKIGGNAMKRWHFDACPSKDQQCK